nr:IlvGEDA operon leader peptide [Sodalis-like endosymbiont of Proechinophthirus fluctus]
MISMIVIIIPPCGAEHGRRKAY